MKAARPDAVHAPRVGPRTEPVSLSTLVVAFLRAWDNDGNGAEALDALRGHPLVEALMRKEAA